MAHSSSATDEWTIVEPVSLYTEYADQTAWSERVLLKTENALETTAGSERHVAFTREAWHVISQSAR